MVAAGASLKSLADPAPPGRWCRRPRPCRSACGCAGRSTPGPTCVALGEARPVQAARRAGDPGDADVASGRAEADAVAVRQYTLSSSDQQLGHRSPWIDVVADGGGPDGRAGVDLHRGEEIAFRRRCRAHRRRRCRERGCRTRRDQRRHQAEGGGEGGLPPGTERADRDMDDSRVRRFAKSISRTVRPDHGGVNTPVRPWSGRVVRGSCVRPADPGQGAFREHRRGRRRRGRLRAERAGRRVVLAAAGLPVEVFEAAATVGGGTRTAELTLPGFRHDVCSAVHPMALASPFFRAFDLAGARRADAPAGGRLRPSARRRPGRAGLARPATVRPTGWAATARPGARCSARSSSTGRAVVDC